MGGMRTMATELPTMTLQKTQIVEEEVVVRGGGKEHRVAAVAVTNQACLGFG